MGINNYDNAGMIVISLKDISFGQKRIVANLSDITHSGRSVEEALKTFKNNTVVFVRHFEGDSAYFMNSKYVIPYTKAAEILYGDE